MATEPTETCPLGLSAEQLSTWRAHGLQSAEASSIATHLPSCPTCRATLSDFDSMDQALQAQRVPARGVELWETLEPRLMSGSIGWRSIPQVIALRTAVRSAFRRYTPPIASGREQGTAYAPLRHIPMSDGRVRSSLRVFRVSATLAAVAFIVVGIVSLLGQRGNPGEGTLSWNRVGFPDGTDLTSYTVPTFVAPADGNVAYACVPANVDSTVQVWGTRDRAQHWMRTADLPKIGPAMAHCWVTVDQLQPQIAVVATAPAPPAHLPSGSQVISFATFDQGAHWQHLSSTLGVIEQVATWHNVTYATTSSAQHGGLLISRDHMQSWQAESNPMHGPGQVMGDFWVQPDTGDVLQLGYDSIRELAAVWLSQNAGQDWSELSIPSERVFIAQQPIAGQPWRLCGYPYTDGSPEGPGRVECSWNGGQTWATYDSPTPSNPFTLLAITQEGDVLAEGTVVWSHNPYRLTAGTAHWQPLVPSPDSATYWLSYSPTASGGVLWAYSSRQESQVTVAYYAASYPV